MYSSRWKKNCMVQRTLMSMLLLLLLFFSVTVRHRSVGGQSTTADDEPDNPLQHDLVFCSDQLDRVTDVNEQLRRRCDQQVEGCQQQVRKANRRRRPTLPDHVPRPTLIHSIPGDLAITALTAFDGKLFVARYDSNQIAVYSAATFELLRHVTVSGASGGLYGLARCSSTDSNCLYVSDYRNHKIHRVNLLSTPPNSSTAKTSWSLGSGPNGISVNRLNNVIVTMANGKIQEYAPNGSLVRELSDSNKLWHAVEHVNGKLAVSRYGPVHGVFMTSLDGDVLSSYGSTAGSGPARMNCPRNVAVTKDGFVIVADEFNHRILILNPTLTEARPLPITVLVNQRTRPLVGCTSASGADRIVFWSSTTSSTSARLSTRGRERNYG